LLILAFISFIERTKNGLEIWQNERESFGPREKLKI